MADRERAGDGTRNCGRTEIFGQAVAPADARILLLPVPFDATCSYGFGAAHGPAGIAAASGQLDLEDPVFGNPAQAGIALCNAPDFPNPEPLAPPKEIRAVGSLRTAAVRSFSQACLDEGRLFGIVGGDHSCPLGAFQALSARGRFSILHIDAHLDLRVAYEGYPESHASIMHNALSSCEGLETLCSVAVRDYCREELGRAAEEGERVRLFPMHDWDHGLASGRSFVELANEAIACLGEELWVSFDIDGLDPSNCPHTGTPVPGGLSFAQATILLELLDQSGRRVLGFDLCEVHGNPEADPRDPSSEWDANVGARILYKLCGLLSRSNERA